MPSNRSSRADHTARAARPNRRYKDSVFSLLFSTPDKLRELFFALQGRKPIPDVPVVINTIRDALFMDQINDISFLIGGALVVLIEFQSTINANMPLRLFLYCARVYEAYISATYGDAIYREGLLKLPRPIFYVLYCGPKDYPDEVTLRLSDAFMDSPWLARKVGKLELTVKVVNINKGHNPELLAKSETLGGFTTLVDKARRYSATMELEAALKRAVRECIKEGVLEDFLREHGARVENMLFTKWDWDKYVAVQKEETRTEERALADRRVAAVQSELAARDRQLAARDRQLQAALRANERLRRRLKAGTAKAAR